MLFSSEDVDAAGGEVFSAANARNNRLRTARLLLWNAQARSSMTQVLSDFRPDIVHYHSISHQLSPSVLGLFAGPKLMTLHDYKLSAPCYTLVRDDDVCQLCVGRRIPTPAIRYQCVSGSTAGSALCVAEDVIHARRFRRHIDRFIVPSQFARDVAIRGGLSEDRLSVVPWGVTSPRSVSPCTSRIAFYGGRFHRTKGIQLLLDAWQSLPANHGCTLRIAGEGELEGAVRNAAAVDPSVQYVGMLPSEDVIKEIQAAAVVIMPSLAPETMGLSALEALMTGTPVISSGRGALEDLRGPGVCTLPRVDVAALRSALIDMLVEGKVGEYENLLRSRDLSNYSAERMVDSIEMLYLRTTGEYRSRYGTIARDID